jgi:hypothetical protein
VTTLRPGLALAYLRSVAAAAALSLPLAAPPAAPAQLLVGVQDDPVFVRLPSAYGGHGARGVISAELGYERLAQLGARVLRITVHWSAVERSHSRSSEAWGPYDAAIARATAAGLTVQLVLGGPAPAFATGDHRIGVNRPSARAYARFAEAAASRYRGQLDTYSIWSEPNWWSSLKPNRIAPMLYRSLYRAGYAAIKHVDPAAKVLIGELAPMGYPEAAIPPLRFLREMTCRTPLLQPWGRCSELLTDGFALHPYTLRWLPSFPGKSADDVTTGSLPRLVRALRALARLKALATPAGAAPDLYLTEYGWHEHYLVTEARRATLAAAGFGIAAHLPQVREIVWYQLAAAPPHDGVKWNTALLGYRGEPTPTFTSLREWIVHESSAP